MRVVGFVATGVAAAAVVGAVLAALGSVSDVRRYLHIRKM